MPNLKTDRPIGLIRFECRLNVRRLMYQSLIWPNLLRYQPRRLRTTLDPQDMEGAADALIDRMGRNTELDCDLLGG